MPTRIPIYRDDMFERMDRDKAELKVELDEILRYQKNFDSEIFCSLSRLEEKIDNLSEIFKQPITPKPIPPQIKQPITKKK